MRKSSIIFKGSQEKKGSKFVKITMVFYRNGYQNRPTRVIHNVTGLWEDWDKKTGFFKPNSSDNIENNKKLLSIHTKYTKVKEHWEENGQEWSPAQLAGYFDEKKDENAVKLKVQNVQKTIEELFEYFATRTKVRNGKAVSSIGNAKCYRDTYLTLQKFTLQKYNKKLSSFYFQDINEKFLNDFIIYI